MPIASVNDDRFQFYYEDSGVPPGSDDYTTLVLVHGAVYHGAIFRPMFYFAAGHNLRLVTLNFRDNPGSTPYSATELNALKDGDIEAQKGQIREQGLELAAFITWFIQTEGNLPVEPSERGGPLSGGIAVLGWSMGNLPVLSMLAHADELPIETQRLFEQYLRVLLLFDPPYFVLGGPGPRRSRLVGLSGKGPPDEVVKTFTLWVNGYYEHSPAMLLSLAEIDEVQLDAGVSEQWLQDPPHQTPTICRMTAAQQTECTKPSIFSRLLIPLSDMDSAVCDENARRALMDKTIWPHLRLEFICIQLQYEDSGAPIGSAPYVTLVLVHGAIFHGAIFRAMLVKASVYNLRIVTVNLRNYPGSTPYSDNELNALGEGPRGQKSIFRSQGLELASFIESFIRAENIPPVVFSGEGKSVSGGLAMLGWSMGNIPTLSTLAHADELSAETQAVFNQYLRTLILFDPPDFVLGAPDSYTFSPAFLAQEPTDEVAAEFMLWVSSYYSHSPSLLSSLAEADTAQLVAGTATESIKDPPPHHAPSLTRMSTLEVTECADRKVFAPLVMPLGASDREVYDENIRRALFDKTICPHLNVEFIWCDMSPEMFTHSMWYMYKLQAEARLMNGRTINLRRLKGANHFAHWDQPEATLRFLADLL
ncbi:uncharacterized protein FIBRA_08510 [Fibroporia radiculosa]|uniref:AB hydrolase-1 domain-containing protein n=1 Tax=Fibroporia radiculosa TaxID=599839 RepID=J4GWX9_9APHY|nr:uncharacterized protein FIBRA_08510 [Fibroporia radiculosa]CCM06260.1 predicted protein [Fibroporia radiculosa]